MNKLSISSSVLTVIMLSAPSFAGDSGFGVFGAIGQAKHDIDISNDNDIRITNDSDTSFAIGGEYRFNSNFTIEVRYDDYGNMTTSPKDEGVTGYNEILADSLSAGIKGGIPLSEQFSIFAKIGFSSWDINTNYSFNYSSLNSTSTESGSLSESGKDLYYGFGGQYSINENIVIGLDYTMLTIDVDNESPDYDIGNLSLSLGYNF